VQTFIADNRSLINDLEESIRCQQQLQREQQSLDAEKSMRAFDQIWNKRLAKNPEDCQQTNKEKEQTREKMPRERPTPQGDRKNAAPPQESGKIRRTQEGDRQQQTNGAVQQKREQKTVKQGSGADKSTNRFAPEKSKALSTSEESSARNMERYAQLTENCTQRIAELTELITKVREEKQRLVEVTLTSNSDGERQSTEYLELPTGQQQTRCRTMSDRSDSQTPSTSEALPLQKHKPTAASRDSGIADSRPITAQGQVCIDVEPISLGSSTQNNTARGRVRAPPATIRRYSPQLNAEDLAHELSTITEVETPGQSHIVAATPVPKPFPSFDQYAKELHLDLSRLDADQSQRLQGEFNDLILAIRQRNQGTDYREFPSINAYLHNMTSTRIHVEIGQDADQATLSPGELMRQLRVITHSIQDFPKRREYFEKLMAKQPPDQRDLIDSASLENDSTDSFNVEEELRQRKILKNSFRRGNATETTLTALEVASSTRRESVAPVTNDQPNESGIDPLSGSNFSSDADQRSPREEPVPAPAPRKSPTKTAKGSPKKTVTAPRNQPSVKRTGLKLNPAPAKVIDAGIHRGQKAKAPATLPKVTAIQKPAVEPPRNLPPIPEQAMPAVPNPSMTHCYPMPQNQPYMHPYAQLPMQPYAMPYSMPFPVQAQFPQPHPMYAPQQMMPNQPAVLGPAITAPPSTATQSTVSTTTITMSSRQDPKTTQCGRVQFYDHSNKYHRTYEAPTQSVQCNEKDATQLTAMDHARIENQLRDLREQELDKLR